MCIKILVYSKMLEENKDRIITAVYNFNIIFFYKNGVFVLRQVMINRNN